MALPAVHCSKPRVRFAQEVEEDVENHAESSTAHDALAEDVTRADHLWAGALPAAVRLLPLASPRC
jgi:hypothetical protein